MLEWLRKIPHPQYGKCGGFGRDCSIKEPKDWLDKAFAQHDEALFEAKTPEERRQADHALARSLRWGDPKKLNWYGKLYRLGAILVFRL